MRRALYVMMAVVIGFALTASAGIGADMKYSGFLGDAYKDLQARLQRRRQGGLAEAGRYVR